MKKLIISANPRSESFTHKIVSTFSELSEKNWDTIEIIDLYNTDLKQDFLWNTECNLNTIKEIQSKINWADELIFVFPIWWWDMPAIMKNFWDINFNAGFAFKYENWKSIGLLKWKTARIIATSGAPSFFYTLLLHIQIMWNMNRIGFCGIKQKSFTVFGNMDSKKTNKDLYLDKLSKLI